jgi:hypothetical protein
VEVNTSCSYHNTNNLYIHSSPKILQKPSCTEGRLLFLPTFLYPQTNIYREISCGIQNVQTYHNSKIRDELQGGMIYNNRYPTLKGPLGTSSSYLGPFLRPPSVQNMLRCTYSSLRIYFSSTISFFRLTNWAS